MPETMNGRSYLRALSYAVKATPKEEERSRLQHVTFVGNRVVGADGTRWHVGYLPTPVEATASYTRVSALNALNVLAFAERYSKRLGAAFSVTHHPDGMLVIECGLDGTVVTHLGICDVGKHPPEFVEPVAPNAAPNPDGHISCDHDAEAKRWWRSWEKDKGTFQVRGGQDGGPFRIDITNGGERVATAFLLPEDHVRAEIREPNLFDKRPAPYGKSNLELDLSGDGAPTDPDVIKIGERTFNVRGLPDRANLLKTGPCDHRDTHDACAPCTEVAVSEAEVIAAQEKADEAEGKPKKRRRKASAAPDAASGA